jgi:hypothetical protein
LEVTYLVIPNAIEAEVEVWLKLKDLDFRSRVVYGKIKASAATMGTKASTSSAVNEGGAAPFPLAPGGSFR